LQKHVEVDEPEAEAVPALAAVSEEARPDALGDIQFDRMTEEDLLRGSKGWCRLPKRKMTGTEPDVSFASDAHGARILPCLYGRGSDWRTPRGDSWLVRVARIVERPTRFSDQFEYWRRRERQFVKAGGVNGGRSAVAFRTAGRSKP